MTTATWETISASLHDFLRGHSVIKNQTNERAGTPPAKLLVAATWRNLDFPRERFQRNVGILHEVATTKTFAGGYLQPKNHEYSWSKMFASSRKPYTAITVDVERLTGAKYDENDLSGIVDLIEVIRIQNTGPTEAARAIRKKLKYGNAHSQIRALTILDSLIHNAGGQFQRTVADEALLEHLRILPTDEMVDERVRVKCNTLFKQWAFAYQNTPGLGGIAALHKQLPTKRKPTASQSKVVRETEALAENENPFEDSTEQPVPARGRDNVDGRRGSTLRSSAVATNSAAHELSPGLRNGEKASKKHKHKPFNVDKEKPKMLEVIASANIASTNLLNALKFINREKQQVSQDKEVVARFKTCKTLRRQILWFIQRVEDEWIGSLLSANDNLVNALMTFEIMDKSIDDDSDSEDEELKGDDGTFPPRKGSKVGEKFHVSKSPKVEEHLAGLSFQDSSQRKPTRPSGGGLTSGAAQLKQVYGDSEDNVDESDPFGDQNAIN